MDTPLGARVGEALRLLADETGEETTSIEVVLAEEVTWSDGSIGCPQPGEMYTQALVDGYRIVLELDGERFTYHGADGEPPFRCDDPAEPVEGS